MLGTLLNVGGIVAGGVAGLVRHKPFSIVREQYLKVGLAALTAFYGLRLLWLSLNGTFVMVLKQFGILLLAMIMGRFTGRLLRLQEFSNRLGRGARDRLLRAGTAGAARPGEGFTICAILFCASPLGLLGAVQDGLSHPNYFYPLAVKAAIDGLAAMGFVRLFGAGVMLSAVPVLAFQGTLTLLCERVVEPFLAARDLVDPVNAAGGMLVACVALLILDLKKVEVADYIPALLYAPLLAWLWR